MAKKLTPSEKYQQLKKHTENAGMKVTEKDGKIVVKRKKSDILGRSKIRAKRRGFYQVRVSGHSDITSQMFKFKFK